MHLVPKSSSFNPNAWTPAKSSSSSGSPKQQPQTLSEQHKKTEDLVKRALGVADANAKNVKTAEQRCVRLV